MINMIAAIGLNNELGHKNKLLCHLPKDLSNFMKLTKNHICIQGKNTFESIVGILGKPLPDRVNIVLTHDKDYKPKYPGVYVYHSVKDILNEYYNYADGAIDIWVIGGGQVYHQFLDHTDKIYLTIIDNKFEADSWFPKLPDEWKATSREDHKKDEHHPYNYSFLTYEKRK
ncbi:dihydrofolate reductase [Metabacillus sp. Hm71]|uniref:dihydrofolate reductase n=1 Tax=Metabacillus sp. Hm71 TaxID=3450743 RepID=UPI003F442F7B